MSDKFAINYELASQGHIFSGIWKLTRVMKAAGWNVKAHSDGTTKTSSGTNMNDSWGNDGDPMLDTYPAFDTDAPWIVLEGPKTIKLIITSAPSGTLVRGEQVTQATSSATGELLGIVYDSTATYGWAVIAPRTGTFNGTNIVTGAISGQTFTPTSVKTFTREVMFSKKGSSSIDSGTIYYICADSSAESTSLFSSLAAQSGCTASIPPGGGGTGNSFPSIAMAVRSTGGDVSAPEYFLFQASGVGFHVNKMSHIAAVNATPNTGISPDGSFYLLASNATPTNSLCGFGFFRLDNGEPGDVDPYAWYYSSNSSFSSFSRTVASQYSTSIYITWTGIKNYQYAEFRGYASRDGYFSARDKVVPFYGTFSSTGDKPMMSRAEPSYMKVQSHPSSSAIYIREPIKLCTDGLTNGINMYKGDIRWMQIIPTGNPKDTLDDKKWYCIYGFNTTNPGVIIGPGDGSSTPL